MSERSRVVHVMSEVHQFYWSCCFFLFQNLERFISSFHALMEHSTHLEQQIQVDHNSPSVPQAKEQLARLTELGDQIEKSPQTTVRDGMSLLRSFEKQQGEAGASG